MKNSPVIVSIVSGSVNRLPSLQRMVKSVREDCQGLACEFVVSDCSTDGSREWLREQEDVRLIEPSERRGAVSAFNGCFRRAWGKYVVNLNDDVLLHPPVIPLAVELLERDSGVGQVAFPFSEAGLDKSYRMIRVHGKDYLYANFGCTRRELGNKLGWWGNYLTFYGGDTHLSVAVARAGYRVEPLKCSGWVEHLQLEGLCQTSVDAKRFFTYWNQHPFS